jgi:hypothetical protein
MRRSRTGWLVTSVAIAVTALPGCNRPSTSAVVVTPPGPEPTPTKFSEACSGDVISLGFPAGIMAAGESGSSSVVALSSGSGGTVKRETYGTFISTPAEADRMMRKLHAELKRLAQEKGCQLEEPSDLPPEGEVTSFTLSYAEKGNRGEVQAKREERTEPEYKSAEQGKVVYTVTVSLSETVARPQ